MARDPRAGLGEAARRHHQPLRRFQRAGRLALAAPFERSSAAQRVIDYTSKHYCGRQHRRDQGAAPPDDPGRHLRSAGGGVFFLGAHRARRGARDARVLLPAVGVRRSSNTGSCIGLPASSAISGRASTSTKRIKTRKAEHLSGFPDFMDLLVVCADAGLKHGGLARRASAASSAIPIRRSPPTSTWPASRSAPAAP